MIPPSPKAFCRCHSTQNRGRNNIPMLILPQTHFDGKMQVHFGSPSF